VPMTSVAGTYLPWPGPDGQPVEARVLFYRITPGYAEALGLRRLEGRWPSAQGATPGAGAVYELLVNESFVRSYVPAGEKVVGRLLPGAFVKDGETSEIVGVVGDVRKDSLEEAPRPEVYAAAGGAAPWSTALALVVRTEGDPSALAPTLRQLVGETDRRWLIEGLGPLTQQIARSTARPRFAVTVLGVFSAVAVVLKAIGLYGALAYAVSLRRRELGVRAVLGADRRSLARLVLRRGLGVTLAGALLGVLAAALFSRSLEALLFGVESRDLVSFVVAPLLLLGVGALACWVPARRAAQADPAVVLRTD
jgi:putative ABC transport system permease protein